MTDSDLAKYIPKVGDRVSIVAFCRQASLSHKSASRKESLLSRLRQRLSGAEGMPPKKKTSKWAGNMNAQRKKRRIEVGWMDFDEAEERFKQKKRMMHLIKLWICHRCLQGRPMFQPKHFLNHNLVL
ncbi:uncharacterized protein LOC127536900 [Xyrichtys novacula]|uniref:Uncharacterized protein LOC127536900 n=1 Tax=Xyrichtys novacula TaxID=13765 RepID=A0AAV1FA59_XYRNO|nr:uncharacterized protein LOC127536900 [Xyrichtys novacula]